MKIDAIVEGFNAIKSDFESEKSSMQCIGKQSDKLPLRCIALRVLTEAITSVKAL